MRPIYLSFYMFILFFASCDQEVHNNMESPKLEETTTFYLIRHAEKDRSNPENRDPELTEKGHMRADYWKEVLNQVPLTAVYSTNYKRTVQTVTPVAEAKALKIDLYDPDTTNLRNWSQKHKGQHVLVVGHSNTTPALVNQLMGTEKYPDIDDSNNGNLYIVQYLAGEARPIILHPEPICSPHTDQP
ncbi:SixA phosphatase family protein [Robertkochia flava]|uniref:SixA phosphatase family protein n=1 Tax=Robertkochia flava TaxID=3447986 RepID=UPI001CCBDB44|nr:phosphoglycerate mutase family protein [Robertkochia marina]